ncbi:MAG: metal-dependent transcriptional regulator [Candidatus Zixiibacteriota bacterium]
MLSSKLEDYLETIYLLSKREDTVGVTEVARERGVAVPTVRTAIVKLQEAGMVRQQPYGKIILTPQGEETGASVYRVHKTLYGFLAEILLIDPKRAEREACRLEHDLSRETLKRLITFLETIGSCVESELGCLSKYRDLVLK